MFLTCGASIEHASRVERCRSGRCWRLIECYCGPGWTCFLRLWQARSFSWPTKSETGGIMILPRTTIGAVSESGRAPGNTAFNSDICSRKVGTWTEPWRNMRGHGYAQAGTPTCASSSLMPTSFAAITQKPPSSMARPWSSARRTITHNVSSLDDGPLRPPPCSKSVRSGSVPIPRSPEVNLRASGGWTSRWKRGWDRNSTWNPSNHTTLWLSAATWVCSMLSYTPFRGHAYSAPMGRPFP